ncbi:MAG TPA: hypothetical protein VJS92_04310 [Candidatus Polarisedimenticolaceae bacterium]|nr:hypothetical protein [Candidatus Polarisedimenticolaceae bacterium]
MTTPREGASRGSSALAVGLIGLPLGALVSWRFGYRFGVVGAGIGFLTVALLALAVRSILRDEGGAPPAVPAAPTSYGPAVLVMGAGPLFAVLAAWIAPSIAGARGMSGEETPWVGLFTLMIVGPLATLASCVLGVAVAVRTFRRRKRARQG